jgi:energy-coupling factor transporter ATP-binding protein EcfA2
VAWARALAAYRELVVRRGSTLQLLGVSGALDNVPFDEADSDIEVDVPEDERSIGREFALALRRRGRVLVVGAPGGGKSTALRATAAHWAQRRDWPTPVLIHLQRVASAEGGLTPAVLQIATEDAVGPARPALRAALEHELERGRLLLLLDGLDEVRTGQKVLVQQLAAWMKELPASIEVVVALRPVAAPNAEQFGFPTLALRAPHRPEYTVDALLEAAAAAHTDPEDWVSARRGWIESAIERDPALGSTPLSVVVLSLIAIRSDDPEALPSTRATILKRALQDILEDWELEHRRRGKVTIGTLKGGLAKRALRETLQVLSEAATREEPATAAEASQLVSECLSRRYPVVGAAAEETADQATAFWIDTGLFAFTDGRVTATIRPFAEVASAWAAADSDPADQDRWLDAARNTADRWPAVALAAGLSRRIAEQWTEQIAESGPAEEFLALCGAVRDGVEVDPGTLARAIESAAGRHLPSPEDAEETAVAIIELPISDRQRADLRPRLSQRVAPDRRPIVETLATVRWEERGADADERLRAFVRAPPPPNPMRRLSPPVDYLLPMPDTRYHSAFEAAMLRLARSSRADAELVIESFDDGSMEFREDLRRVLTAAGHQDLADRVNRDLESAAAKARSLMSTEEFDAAERQLLAWAADLAAPAPLTRIQLRRLDDLADLWATAALQWAHPKWVARWPKLARDWLCIAAHLSGFDLPVIAAEAQTVLDDMDAGDETDRLIYDAGQAREPTLWERVPQPSDALAALMGGIGSPHEIARAIARAIPHAPRELQADLLLERRMHEVRNWSRWFAARLVILCAPDCDARAAAFARDEDPLLRAAAAEWWSLRVASASAREADLIRCFTDRDEGVRNAALAMLRRGEISDALRPALVHLRGAQRQAWQCRTCGTLNPSGRRTACVNCSRSGPNVASRLEQLLDAGTQ